MIIVPFPTSWMGGCTSTKTSDGVSQWPAVRVLSQPAFTAVTGVAYAPEMQGILNRIRARSRCIHSHNHNHQRRYVSHRYLSRRANINIRYGNCLLQTLPHYADGKPGLLPAGRGYMQTREWLTQNKPGDVIVPARCVYRA